MDYKIVDTWIDNDRLCCHVLMIHASGFEELVTVPVKLPKTGKDVTDAINARCKAEAAKYDYIAQITPIKNEVDKQVGVKTVAVM